MNTTQIIRSQPVTWAASSTAPVNLAFLDSAKGRNPQVTALYAQVSLTCSTTAGTAIVRGALLHQFLSRIVLADGSGERINLGGASLRILNSLEGAFSTGYDDPDDVKGNSQAASFFIRLPIVPRSTTAFRESDFFLSVRELRDGGRLEMTFGSATPVTDLTIANGTITWYAEIVDASPSVTSRLVLRENVMSQTDDVYVVGGAVRFAVPYVGATSENAGTTWAAQNIDSFTLDYSQIPSAVFLERYKQSFPNLYLRRNPTSGAVGLASEQQFKSYLDPVVQGYAIPFVACDPFQQTTKLRFVDSVIHYRTSATFTNQPLFLTSVIQPRATRAAQVATGAPGALASDAVRSGTISGTDKAAASFGARATSVLPVDLTRK